MSEPIVGAGVGVMILKNGEVLLGQRHEDPEKASSLLDGQGTWTMPGGKLHYGETFEEIAIRETEEETGIKLNRIKVICFDNNIGKRAQFITAGLLAKTDEEPKVMEPDEITEWQWFDLENLPSPLYPPSVKILEHYKNKTFY